MIIRMLNSNCLKSIIETSVWSWVTLKLSTKLFLSSTDDRCSAFVIISLIYSFLSASSCILLSQSNGWHFLKNLLVLIKLMITTRTWKHFEAGTTLCQVANSWLCTVLVAHKDELISGQAQPLLVQFEGSFPVPAAALPITKQPCWKP